MRRLHLVIFCAVISRFGQFADHASRRNVEYPVEMQSACFFAAFPYADMFPALTGNEMLERIAERLPKTFLGMQLIRIGKSAEETPFL